MVDARLTPAGLDSLPRNPARLVAYVKRDAFRLSVAVKYEPAAAVAHPSVRSARDYSARLRGRFELGVQGACVRLFRG